MKAYESTTDKYKNGFSLQHADQPVPAIQCKGHAARTSYPVPPTQPKSNHTGLPDALKAGIENQSGYSMDDVKVHYNSDKPAQLQALAYAQGTDIHVAPGQGKHLPHEAWHVVQQKQRRVQPTLHMRGVALNDDKQLENEADVMGAAALNSPIQRMLSKEYRQQSISSKPNEMQDKPHLHTQLATGPECQSARPVQKMDANFNLKIMAVSSASAMSTPIIQRNEKSAKKLRDMATPQIFQVQDVKLQDRLVESLEKVLTKKSKEVTIKEGSFRGDAYIGESCVGGIELTALGANDDLNDLIKNAKLVDIKDRAMKLSTFDLVKMAGLDSDIVSNTLQTMLKAGQLDYLQASGLINSKWKIIIEVHYIFNRNNIGKSIIHKDTLGETLFVNLNYINKKKITGPEYVINPESDMDDQERINRNLPQSFLKDLQYVRKELGEPSEIKTGEIMENGVIAFVDEAIHHMTPVIEHRKISSKQISIAYPEIKTAYDEYSKRIWISKYLFNFSSYLKDEFKEDATGWFEIMSKIGDRYVNFNRKELTEMLPSLTEEKINQLIEIGGDDQFGGASIPRFKDGQTVYKRVKAEGRPPLKRQMSEELLKENPPKKPQKDEKRTFFRTWVRAVRVKS